MENGFTELVLKYQKEKDEGRFTSTKARYQPETRALRRLEMDRRRVRQREATATVISFKRNKYIPAGAYKNLDVVRNARQTASVAQSIKTYRSQ